MREGELSTKGVGGGGGQRLFTTNNTYLCSKKMCQESRGLPQNCYRGQAQKCPSMQKRGPPTKKKWPPYIEIVYTFRTNRKKIPHRGKKKHRIFFYAPPSRERLLFLLFACADHDLHSL